MSFPRYPAYKDSGVEWLGEVPAHWMTTRLKFVATVQTGIAKGKDNGGRAVAQVPYLRVANVQDGYLSLDDVATIEIPVEDLDRYCLKDGDVLMNEGGDFDKLGRGHIWRAEIDPCIHQNHVFAVRPFAMSSTWLNRLTGSDYAQTYFILRSKQTTNLASISSTNLMNLPVVVPPVEEQAAIEGFLDRETAKIDALVEEFQTLIALLKEKRQAVISHAVTKGLDPTVPMKDSGVEWLGEVPAHWRIGKCGFYMTILSGFAFPSEGFSNDDADTKLLRGINVGVSQLKWDEVVYWRRSPDDNLQVYEMRAGDLVIGMDRPLIGAGIRIAKVKETDLPCLLLQRVASLKVGTQLNTDYLHAAVSSEMFVAHIRPDTTGVSVPHISPEQIKNFVIPIPPPQEQATIAASVERESVGFASLVAEAEQAISFLHERRTALISAAVTGKIDVRGLAEAAA